MSQQPDTYNIIEIKCMDSDAIRLFVDKAEYEKQAARIKELESGLRNSVVRADHLIVLQIANIALAALKGEQK